jgi:putative protease
MVGGRSGNRGECAQPCRLPFNGGKYVLSLKDLSLANHINELIDSGVASLKIEGRMKSAYYTAVATNAYRMAIDSYYADKENYKFDPLWMRELESVSHREYCTGFYFDYPIESAQLTSNTGYIREKAYFAIACEMDEQEKEAQARLNESAEGGKYYLFMQKNKCKLGDSAEIISPSTVGRALDITDLRDSKGEPIESAPHPFMHFFVKVPFDVKVGDILRAGE